MLSAECSAALRVPPRMGGEGGGGGSFTQYNLGFIDTSSAGAAAMVCLGTQLGASGGGRQAWQSLEYTSMSAPQQIRNGSNCVRWPLSRAPTRCRIVII